MYESLCHVIDDSFDRDDRSRARETPTRDSHLAPLAHGTRARTSAVVGACAREWTLARRARGARGTARGTAWKRWTRRERRAGRARARRGGERVGGDVRETRGRRTTGGGGGGKTRRGGRARRDWRVVAKPAATDGDGAPSTSYAMSDVVGDEDVRRFARGLSRLSMGGKVTSRGSDVRVGGGGGGGAERRVDADDSRRDQACDVSLEREWVHGGSNGGGRLVRVTAGGVGDAETA